MRTEYKTIAAYDRGQKGEDRDICEKLRGEIEHALPDATSKIWHGSPVWFLDGNPIVGYHRLKDGMRLLFWSGQSFETPGLAPEGSFKAAEIRYISVKDIRVTALRKWLKEGKRMQWDYKNIVKHKGLRPLTKGAR